MRARGVPQFRHPALILYVVLIERGCLEYHGGRNSSAPLEQLQLAKTAFEPFFSAAKRLVDRFRRRGQAPQFSAAPPRHPAFPNETLFLGHVRAAEPPGEFFEAALPVAVVGY